MSTEDYAYGEDDCKQLAITDPAQAFENGDNWAFFAKYA